MPVPAELRTARLLLRAWRVEDAEPLLPVLIANRDHLLRWIPARVAEPAPLAALRERLEGFARTFANAHEWRYGLFTADGARVLGEVSLFPRDASTRVPYEAADRVEIGYWLRADETGHGFVTEATEAVLAAAATVPGFTCAEIRCDARNERSAAVPRRLGFVLATSAPVPGAASDEGANELQVWRRTLPLSSD